MGIRFRCHHCDYELHVKDFQAGKRGKCPECQGKFRIPVSDAANSLSIENEPESQFDNQQPTATESPSDVDLADSGNPALQPAPLQSATAPTGGPVQASSELPALPNALAEAPGATWYVRPTSGGQFGPAANDMFQQWLLENRINRDSLIWREGWPQWLVAAEVLSDYFGPDLPQALKLAPAPLDPSANADRATTQPASLGDRNRSIRKQRRKRNYTLMVTLLLVLTIILVGALVVVLILQQQ